MLVTTCSHCGARFRVTPQQLNQRQGQVRCGRCTRVFSGFQALERFPDDDTGARLLAAAEARERDSALRPVEEDDREIGPGGVTSAPGEPEMPELESIDVPSRPLEPAPGGAGADEPRPHAAQSASPEPAPGEAAPPRGRSRRSRREARGAAVAAEPELVLAPPPRTRPARAWAFGTALLAVVLLLEAAFAFRGPVAQRYPALRPALEAACEPLGCNVPYARQDGMLKVEESEMLEVPGKPGEIALGARIRNLASVAQEYPHIELTLTDNTGRPAARRVLRPSDFFGRALASGEVIGPGAELAVQLRLETPGLKPTGYQLLLFYP